MIRIHGAGLTTVIASLVCVFIVHVIWYPNFGENEWMVAHTFEAFLSKELELVAKTVPDSGLSNLDGECRREILPTKNANHVDIINPVPKWSVGENLASKHKKLTSAS